MLFGIFIFPRNDSLLLIREIFRSDASSAGLAHVCDWSDASALVPFYVHVQPFIWKTLDLPRPTCAEVRCRLCSDDSGEKLRQSGLENELLNRFTDQVEEKRVECDCCCDVKRR